MKNGNHDTVRSFTTDTGWKKSLSIVFGQVRSGQIRNIFLPVHSGVTHIKGHIYEGVLVKRGWTKLAPVIATILIPLYRGLFIDSENRAWFYRAFLRSVTCYPYTALYSCRHGKRHLSLHPSPPPHGNNKYVNSGTPSTGTRREGGRGLSGRTAGYLSHFISFH